MISKGISANISDLRADLEARDARDQNRAVAPLKPAQDALVLDMEDMPELGIRRSLKPAQLPVAVYEYLMPRERICCFFERTVDSQG